MNAKYKLMECVWKKEEIPDSWRETVIVQLPKSNGKDPTDLDNKRNIHTKDPIAKVFGHLVTNNIKPKIVENLSPFQIGAIPNHRSEEHLFTLKSVLGLVEMNDDAIGIELLDIVTFFDSECLVDAMDELYKANVKGT